MLLTVAPGVASAQTQPQARGTDNVCDTLGAYDRDRFDDTRGSAHERNVLCMADRGLTEGTRASGGQSYAPRAEVTRAQMASFIARFIRDYNAEFGGPELPPGEPNRFDDVAAPFVHTDNINALAGVQIVAGTNASGGDSYAPQASVTRGQTASLIRRTLSWLDDGNPNNASVPPPGADVFPDVDPTFTHFANINAVAGVGIVQGFTDGNYRPQESVLRDQMASFVMRAYDYAVEFELGVEDDPVDPVDPIDPVDPDEADFNVELSWFNEVADTPGEGPLFGQGQVGATGFASLIVDEDDNTITYTVDFSEVDGPFGDAPGFHIHEGTFAENGPVEVTLATGAELDAAADASSFTATVDGGDFDVSDLFDEDEDYYLNLHSNEFPAGAIRGQLPDGPIDLNLIDVAIDAVDTESNTADFTASNLNEDLDYRITLVPEANVAADGEFNSGVLFSETLDDAPDAEGVAVADSNFEDNDQQPAIFAVNGEDVDPMNPRTVGGVEVDEDGEITFSSTLGTNGEDFHAFVYPEGGDSSFLEVVGANDAEVAEGVILEIHGFSDVVDGGADPVIPDPDAPVIIETQPADEAIDVEVDTAFVGVFDQDVDIANVTVACLEAGFTATGGEVEGDTVTFTPDENLPFDADCSATFSGGNANGTAEATVTFTTVAAPDPDPEDATLDSVEFLDAAGVEGEVDSGDTWFLTFSESVDTIVTGEGEDTDTGATFVIGTDADPSLFTVQCVTEDGVAEGNVAALCEADDEGNLIIILQGEPDGDAIGYDGLLVTDTTITTTEGDPVVVPDDGVPFVAAADDEDDEEDNGVLPEDLLV